MTEHLTGDLKIPPRLEHSTKINIPRQLVCLESNKKLDLSQIKPIKNNPKYGILVKPDGGLWASSYTPYEKYCSDWIKWCISEVPSWLSEDCYILTPSKEAKVYVIDRYLDLENLMVCGFRREDSDYLNFEKMTEYWDGVMLTVGGQARTRLSKPFSLYGWDCESTLWFRNVFRDAMFIKKDIKRTCKLGR